MDRKDFDLWLEEVRKLGSKPGLNRVKKLLELLDNPQNKLDIIHITGTNGKGSTASILSNILIEGEYNTGQFSTPSILGFNDMFRINNKMISDLRLLETAEKIKNMITDMLKEGYEHPTEYEIISAIMYEYFYQEHVDFAVVEVAMGGENDCTNVMDYSIMSIITPISLDHNSFLGDTLRMIAKEKSGVMKNNSVCYTHKQEDEVMEVLKTVSDEKMSVLNVCGTGVDYSIINDEMSFSYNGIIIKSKLLGTHQMDNIVCVVEVIQNLKTRGYIDINKKMLLDGIYNTYLEGRFEIISREPKWIIDGAHNSESLKALLKNIKTFKYKNLIGIIGVLKDKNIDDELKEILTYFKTIILTEPLNLRKLSVDELEKKIKDISDIQIVKKESVKEAVEICNRISANKDVVLGFGSFYMISEIRRLKLLEKTFD